MKTQTLRIYWLLHGQMLLLELRATGISILDLHQSHFLDSRLGLVCLTSVILAAASAGFYYELKMFK